MLRALAGAVLLVFVSATPSFAADAPPRRIAQAAPSATPAAPVVAAHGALVVAVTDDAADAAHALAFDVYRDVALRPAIDDATARILAGEAPPEDAPKKLKDTADVRASIAKAGGDAAARHLLGSLGTEFGAELVVAVSLDGTRPVAKILRPASSAFERIDLGAAIETTEGGARVVRWPGATILLEGLVAHVVAKTEPLRPLATPMAASPPPKDKPVWTSPWFWGAVGGVAAVGLAVFVLSKTTGDPGSVHLSGHVGP